MASVFVLALALFAAAASANPARIIGGSSTSIETWPSIVQVESTVGGVFWSHHCAGSILNSVYILSAAHCFAGTGYDASNRRIRAGSSTLESGIILYVAQENNHPSYGQNGNDGDITVVRLSSALIFSSTIAAGSIVAAGTTIPGNLPVTKLGWGITAVDGDRAEELQSIQVLTLDNSVCASNYATLTSSPQVTSNMICAGSSTADACVGDGGGPVYFGNIIVGVISWGNGCLQDGFPGVNTAVSPYTPWIVATTSS